MLAPAVDLLSLNTLRGTKTTFVAPKGYGKHLPSFLNESPSPPPPPPLHF